MMNNDEDAVVIGDGQEPVYESLKDVRVMRNGRSYWVPDPSKRVIDLEEDCGLLLFDVAFFQQIAGFARAHIDESNQFVNTEWKKRNLIPFQRPWRPSFGLPKSPSN